MVGRRAKKIRKRISLSLSFSLPPTGLDQITISHNFKINPISVSVSMVACSGYLTLVVVAGVVVAAVGVGISSVGEGMVAIEAVVELGLSLSLALGNVDGASALGMVHALASIAYGLHGIIGVGLGLHMHRLEVGDRLVGSSIGDGLVGSGVGGVLVVGHGGVEVCGLGLSLALGNVDSAGALGMVHALASIAHGLHGPM